MKLIILLVAMFAGCAAVSGPCVLHDERVMCQEGGSATIIGCPYVRKDGVIGEGWCGE